jgi:hypothetical protein
MKNGLIQYPNGTKRWFKDGQLHRDDGPAVEHKSGDRSWFKNGQRHREDGPAIEWANGYRSWYKDGKLHKEDGPAVIWAIGECEWFINGQRYSFNEWCEASNQSPMEKAMLRLRYSVPLEIEQNHPV